MFSFCAVLRLLLKGQQRKSGLLESKLQEYLCILLYFYNLLLYQFTFYNSDKIPDVVLDLYIHITGHDIVRSMYA